MALLPLPVWAYLMPLGVHHTRVHERIKPGGRRDPRQRRVRAGPVTLDAGLIPGPLLGLLGAGFAVATLGGRHAVLCSAGLYLVGCIWVLAGMTEHPALPVPSDAGMSTIRASLHGNLTLLRNRSIRTLMLAQWLPPALLTGVDALIVPYAGGRGLAPGTAGWLLAGAPAGMIAGNLVIGRLVGADGHVAEAAPAEALGLIRILWKSVLANLIGRSCALLLLTLEEPTSTTRLARRLRLAPGAVGDLQSHNQ